MASDHLHHRHHKTPRMVAHSIFFCFVITLLMIIGRISSFQHQPCCRRNCNNRHQYYFLHPIQQQQRIRPSLSFISPCSVSLSSSTSLSSSSSSSAFSILEDRFDRWRFLQDLLEGDADPNLTNVVLYQVLDGALKYRRPRGPQNDDDANDNDYDTDATLEEDVGGPPAVAAAAGPPTTVDLEDDMSVEVREKMEQLLKEFENDGYVGVFQQSNDDEDPEQQQQRQEEEGEEDQQKLAILERLEGFLPDPNEDEEAHKSLWDLVIELHGRESVKSNEMSNPIDVDWKLRNVVARILIHHDFLSLGIVDGPLY
mmetsp:Transcript_10642/g.25378  ORF Transcript_10642/g.25378 Transcript_10642/m.25378 type:complete len:312 (-) Transcript_10642:1376-2311(-)